jgi:hypothetical protein
VTVLAVVNFVLGGLGLLSLFCGGLAVLLLAALVSNMPPPPKGQPDPFKELGTLFQSIPGFIPYMIVTTVLGTIMTIVLVVAGFGLLKMRRWARTACLVYAVYTILSTVAGGIYTFAVMQPAVQKWQVEFEAKMKKAQPKGAPGAPTAPAGPPPTVNAFTNVASTVAGEIIGIAYAVALLIVLNRRDIRAAFARAGTEGTEIDERAARAWERDEPPDIMDQRPGRLRDRDERVQGSDEPGY